MRTPQPAFSFAPFAPRCIAICAAAIFEIIIGTKNGLTLQGAFVISVSCCVSSVSIPPTPRSCYYSDSPGIFLFHISPEFSKASRAAINPNWVYLSILRASFLSIYSAASKSLDFSRNFALKIRHVKRGYGVHTVSSLFMPSQKSLQFFPIGVIAPTPVTTTRFINISIPPH